MSERPPEEWRPEESECRLTAQPAGRIAAACLGAGVLLLGAAWFTSASPAAFWQSYYVAFCFFLSLSLGALFFVLLHHLVDASWSVVVRRVAETFATVLPLLLVLFLPFAVSGGRALLALQAPHEPSPAEAALLAPGAASLRALFYLVLWSLLALTFWRRSVAQDTSGGPSFTLANRRWSAPAMLLFGFSVPIAGADLLMTLHPSWQSTVFGVVFFAGCAMSALALLPLAVLALQAAGPLRRAVTVEHYHDLGKLLFAFVFFWAYVSFSQYMLIWYADLPEETQWFQLRASPSAGTGNLLSLVILFGHWLLPFVALMSREMKRRKAALAFWCAWLLVAHYFGLRWLAAPEWGEPGLSFTFSQAACLLGMGALYLGAALWLARRHALLPLKDPYLVESLAFENY
jgi:hypothetical protein